MQQETGNDFRFADWRMDLLEEWSAESENALGPVSYTHLTLPTIA